MIERDRTPTPRQREILVRLMNDETIGEVATALGISRFTVRTHAQNIITRYRVHSLTHAVALAIAHGHIGLSQVEDPKPAHVMGPEVT